MKTIPFFVLLMFIPFATLSYAENSFEYTEAKLQWSEHNFGITNGTGTAKIILTDPDSNKISYYAETVPVFVYSDSFPKGIDLTLYETGKNSGIFERSFSFSDTRSAPSVLYAREGDTAIVTYTDTTLPADHVFSEVHLMETTLIGLLGYPIERLPASNARIINLSGNEIDSPIVGEQILLMSDIASQEDHPKEFVWIAQTIDSQKITVSLSWINGTINSQSSFSPSTSWIPQEAGDYSTVFFVWESLDNPTALSPPIQIEFSVTKENTKKTTSEPDKPQCIGDELCISETIVRIVDGDTLYLQGGYEVRLSLTNTPERHQIGFHDASQFTAKICPVTMTAVFDQDDLQPYDVYGRLVGKITCNDKVLNSELLYAGHANILKQYCTTSEFSEESWAKEFGC
jgi:endonuclease YncB( thermonuclease family)